MQKRALINFIGVLLVLVAFVGCSHWGGLPVVPRSATADQFAATIRALPEYAHFSLAGVVFFRDKLYVSSNIGLLVFNGTNFEALYKWVSRDDVVEGPWVDVAHDALWIHHAHDNYLRRFDGISWRLITPPIYRHRSAITIFRGISSPTGFWLLAGGRAWRYQDGRISWVLEPKPPAPQYSETEAVAFPGESMFYVVREVDHIWYGQYAVYDRENHWARHNLSDKMEFGGVITTPEGAFIRAEDGRLFLIGSEKVQMMETPGHCDAITRTSAGKLLASFVDRGIFLLDNSRWELKAAYPYGPEEGEHWAYLAESNGKLAYATTSVPQNQAGKTFYSGSVALWVLRGGNLEQVTLN